MYPIQEEKKNTNLDTFLELGQPVAHGRVDRPGAEQEGTQRSEGEAVRFPPWPAHWFGDHGCIVMYFVERVKSCAEPQVQEEVRQGKGGGPGG